MSMHNNTYYCNCFINRNTNIHSGYHFSHILYKLCL
ncbi:Hypothetical protein DSVG11_2057 [Desulfovibrio sp. G11]|nr:Hypothetical protein DSVG11_2057 [Desulfovibrio sp. G11]